MFVTALCLLALSCLLAALSGKRPWANALGAGGACLACVLGFASLFADPWHAHSLMKLPWGLPFGACSIGLDPLTRVFLAPSFGLGAVCALSGAAHLAPIPLRRHNPGAHWAFYSLLILGLALMLAARDAVLFLLAWELMSLAPFFLIDLYDHDVQVREASWIYLVAAHLGTLCLIAMFGLLWAQTGSTSFDAFALAVFPLSTGNALFALALAGFGAKAGIVPLHVWLPEAHPAAPSHISAMLSGAMIHAGMYGLARSLDFFGEGSICWGWALVAAGVCTGLGGILRALGQGDLKRLLAYHSVENMGIALIGIGTGYIGTRTGNVWMAALGYSGAFFHLLNHSAMKGLLFLCAGEVLHGAATAHLGLLGGLQKRMPWTGAAFVLGATAISCLPPLNGFIGKFLLILALLKGCMSSGFGSQIALCSVLFALVLMGGLTAAAFAKAYGIGFLGEARSEAARNAVEAGPLNRACLLALALCCLGFALGAPWIFSLLISPAALSLFPAGMGKAVGAQAVVEAMALLEQLLGLSLSVAALTGAFLLLRKLLLRRSGGVREARTWDCGYQLGTPRIQYSPASFVAPLTKLFAPIVGMSRNYTQWGEFFPSRARCEVRISGGLLRSVFTPFFEGLRQLCDRLKVLQHGHIHLYILHILIVIAALLVWGLL
jgi:hydrogenase-4 component B